MVQTPVLIKILAVSLIADACNKQGSERADDMLCCGMCRRCGTIVCSSVQNKVIHKYTVSRLCKTITAEELDHNCKLLVRCPPEVCVLLSQKRHRR